MTDQVISHYRIIRTLGSGGMGVVYEAEDLTLGRRVALKALPPEFALDEARRQRFTREAKAVAALNHPNIVTVYAIEEHEGRHYIAMELVDGRTLQAHIPKKGMPLADTLKIAEQLADALAAAHSRGIIHRDVKPANIIVTPEVRIKVLDFGLSKLREGVAGEASTTTAAAGDAVTGEGRIVGTVAYMSPEQAQGSAVDHRSDIFSMGIVLYEMVTGVRPFVGDTNVAVLSSIIKDHPRLASDANALVPIELARIIRRCLQKDPEQRYQSAKDLRNEISELREESASGELFRARGVIAPSRLSIPRLALVGCAVLVVGGGLAVGLVKFGWLTTGRAGADGPRVGIPSQVTAAAGWESEPAVSPDGSLIAYVSNESGNADVWLVSFRGGTPMQLTSDPANDVKPAWMPDGSTIVFASDRSGQWDVWKVPVLGGRPTLLVENARDPAITPAGDRIAFVRTDSQGHQRVFAGPVSNTSLATQLVAEPARALQPEEDPAWSPDGRVLAYSADRSLWMVSALGGPAKALTHDREYDIEPAWSPDGQSVYFSSYRGGVYALWQVPAAGGSASRLTSGAGPERHPTVSIDGRRLAFSTFTENMDLVVRDVENGHEEPFGTSRDEVSPAFSRDGRLLVYVADSGPAGGTELWIQPIASGRAEGQPHRVSEFPGAVSHPDFSRDGRWLVFQRTLQGSRDIWTVPVSGGSPVRFTDDIADDLHPSWSPDGGRIVFVSSRSGQAQLWVAPVSDGRPGGAPQRLTSEPASHAQPAWSPDGAQIACVVEDGERSEVWTIRTDGTGEPRRVTSGASAGFVRWEPHSRYLLASGTWGGTNMAIRRVDPQTGTSQPLTPPVIIGRWSARPMFDISRDGRWLTFSRGNGTGDVWVSEILRKRP